MALVWDYTIRGVMINRGIKLAMAASCAITIYKGTQPSAADILANWSNYKTSSPDCLTHYTGSVWTQQPAHGQLLAVSTLPVVTPAFNSGEATWGILWMTDVTLTSAGGDTLPNSSFILIPCSDSIGKGVVRYTDPIFVAGVSKQITEASISAVS